jgi:hypothetical protein
MGEVFNDTTYFDKAGECLARASDYAYPRRPDGTHKIVHASVAGYGFQRNAELALTRDERERAAELYDSAIEILRIDEDWLGEARALAVKGYMLRDVIGKEAAHDLLERANVLLISHDAPESEVVTDWLLL